MLSRIGNDVLRGIALLGGLVVAGALLLSTADPRAAQFRFDQQKLGTSAQGSIVSLALDARPGGSLYASTDGGLSSRAPAGPRLAMPGPPGDLAVDALGRIFSAGHDTGGLTVTMSSEAGAPPRRSTIDVASGDLAAIHAVAREDGLLVVSAVVGKRLRVWLSTDQARTFTEGGQIESEVAAAGPIIVGPFGSLFAGVVTPEGLLGVAASADGGMTWSARGVTTVSDVDRSPPSIAVDDAATLYVAFTTSSAGTSRLSIAHTTDLGLTWSDPLTAAPPGSHSPQLVAGSLGKIGLAYISGDELVYRYTTEALLKQPFWTENLVARAVTCPCTRAPYEVTLTTRSRVVFAVRSAGDLVVTQQMSGAGVR